MTSEVNEIKENNKDIINEIARRIVDTVKPQKIILFGSHAYGNPDKNSDIDILVIMKSKLPRYKRSVPIYKALAGILIPKDIIVYTPEEVKEWSDVPQSFVTTAISKGKPIYEKN
jgi:predicted nucleotidyltransferase